MTINSTVCVDFVNTVESRLVLASGETILRLDQFGDYENLTAWSAKATILSEKGAARLNKMSGQEPLEAEYVRRRAVALREAIHHLFLAVINRKPFAAQDLSILNEELSKSLSKYRLIAESKQLKLTWIEKDKALDQMLWVVAKSAADFLSSGDLPRLRQCSGENCSKLFFDTSRNGRRAWCDMKTCGNLAKVRRFRSKQKAENDRSPACS